MDQLSVPIFWGSLGFYSSVESNFYACATSLFHIGKILINGRIFQNLLRIRILFMLGFYGLGLIMRRKLFPFKIPWRPHNDQVNATWPFGPSTPVRSYRIRPFPAHISWSVKPIQMDLSSINSNSSHPIFFLFSCPLTPWVRALWVDGPSGWRFNLDFRWMPSSLDRLS